MNEVISNFPSVYKNFTFLELIKVYEAGPSRLRTAIQGLTEQELRANPREGKWSIFEIVIHLADAELVGAARIRKVFSQPGNPCLIYDQELWAKNFDYAGMDIFEFKNAIYQFDVLRCSTGRIFHRAKKKDWIKTGTHPDYGQISLRQLLELYADHSERHLGQILFSRELLHKPLDMPLLLKERLIH